MIISLPTARSRPPSWHLLQRMCNSKVRLGLLPYQLIDPPELTSLLPTVLSCDSEPLKSSDQIRIIINDGVVPLNGIQGCPTQKEGMCPLDTFVTAQKEMISKTSWKRGCGGDWEVPKGNKWETTTGDPPRPAT
jgi:hypothetical protein